MAEIPVRRKADAAVRAERIGRVFGILHPEEILSDDWSIEGEGGRESVTLRASLVTEISQVEAAAIIDAIRLTDEERRAAARPWDSVLAHEIDRLGSVLATTEQQRDAAEAKLAAVRDAISGIYEGDDGPLTGDALADFYLAQCEAAFAILNGDRPPTPRSDDND